MKTLELKIEIKKNNFAEYYNKEITQQKIKIIRHKFIIFLLLFIKNLI